MHLSLGSGGGTRLRAYSPALKRKSYFTDEDTKSQAVTAKASPPSQKTGLRTVAQELPARAPSNPGVATIPLLCPLRLQHGLFWNLFRSCSVLTHPKMQTRGALRSALAPQGSQWKEQSAALGKERVSGDSGSAWTGAGPRASDCLMGAVS